METMCRMLKLNIQKQPLEVFYKRVVLKNFAKFARKGLCQRLFLNKVASGTSNFIEKKTQTQVFSCKFCEIFKNNFFTEQPQENGSELRTPRIILINFYYEVLLIMSIPWKHIQYMKPRSFLLDSRYDKPLSIYSRFVGGNDHLVSYFSLMCCYGINTNILHLPFSIVEF